MRTAYYSFKDEDEIIAKVSKVRTHIEKLLVHKLALSDIINTAIGSNTYRVFRRNGATTPSSLFKKWAFSVLGNECDIKLKLCVETKEQFDLFFSSLCNDLLETWNSELDGMTIFRSRKMVTLLLKNLVFWEGFNNDELLTYITRVPLPLDSRTLSAIRIPYNKTGKYIIPNKPTMGFINQEDKYTDLQNYMHNLAAKAGIPVIYLDYLYFDFEEKE
jgi:hypothetical protein